MQTSSTSYPKHIDIPSWTFNIPIVMALLTRSLREPGGPCTKSMEVSEYRIERVKKQPTVI